MISRSNLEATMPVTVTNQQDEMTDEGVNTDLEALLPDTRPGRAVVEVKDCQPSPGTNMGWDKRPGSAVVEEMNCQPSSGTTLGRDADLEAIMPGNRQGRAVVEVTGCQPRLRSAQQDKNVKTGLQNWEEYCKGRGCQDCIDEARTKMKSDCVECGCGIDEDDLEM